MRIDIKENDLKQGILGLVLALVEVIRDTLEIQALRRMESADRHRMLKARRLPQRYRPRPGWNWCNAISRRTVT